MSVKVTNLSKVYEDQRAVDGISFEAKPGDVLGFLGPNGAGKSTTMKIITCFLPQTSGNISVCDLDTITQSQEVKMRIGYLPENNPLYYDMYVKEYLHFIAGLHPHIKNKTSRIREMISITGLEKEQTKKIGALSKGYKQRVGIAQAMIHNPDVLIMDEPTSGLDPNQIVEVRNLIKNLGKEKTVIFSTHIMQEVEAICNRVIIINKGKIVADDSIQSLQLKKKDTVVIQVSFKETVDKNLLLTISGVNNIQETKNNSFKIICNKNIQEDIFRFAVDNKLTILSLTQESESLEDIFRNLTKNK
jgi:ABC-2 type transport system ATP-binding protein